MSVCGDKDPAAASPCTNARLKRESLMRDRKELVDGGTRKLSLCEAAQVDFGGASSAVKELRDMAEETASSPAALKSAEASQMFSAQAEYYSRQATALSNFADTMRSWYQKYCQEEPVRAEDKREQQVQPASQKSRRAKN